MSNPTSRRMRGEPGVSLVLALAFISIFGIISAALLSFGDASIRATDGFRTERTRNYASDAALDGGINRIRHTSTMGRDPAIYPADKCGSANGQNIFSLPASGSAPAMVVSCVVGSGSQSGLSKDLGSAPPDAVLTLGDTQTDGTNKSLGARSSDPGPYNGNQSDVIFGSDPCVANRQEAGIRVNQMLSPSIFYLFGVPITYSGCNLSSNAASWNVSGSVVSNSTIFSDASGGGGGPVVVQAPDSSLGKVKARYGCTVSGLVCDPSAITPTEGNDPGYAPPDVSGLTVQSVPPASLCTTGNHVVTFSPGIYTDATAMNNLFGDANCKSATFLFPPHKNGAGQYDSTGLYYFNFQNTTSAPYNCGQDSLFFDIIATLPSDNMHQWCVAGKASDYSAQHVIGGTPYNWDPNADQSSPTIGSLTLAPAGLAGNGPGAFFGLFPQTTSFTSPTNAKAVDGSTADLTMGSSRSGGSIWTSQYPTTARGSVQTANLAVSYSTVNGSHLNNPTIQLNFGTKFGDPFNSSKCGPYSLQKPSADNVIQTIALSPADATAFTTCLNQGDAGDRINTGNLQFNVSRPTGQGSFNPAVKLDGIKINLTVFNQPTFPRMPSDTDKGGDCDPAKWGAQFIFGGDSHVYVPNGGMEVCAGPNKDDQANGQQIAVYGVPAVPRLVPNATPATSGSITNAGGAQLIADPLYPNPGINIATLAQNSSMTFHLPSYTPPAGTQITNLTLRASYNPQTATSTPPQFVVQTTGGGTICSATTLDTSGSGMRTKTYDVTGCLKPSIGSAFDVKWNARGGSCSGLACQQLDGIQVIVTLGLANVSTQNVLIPENGCATASPNYWYGVSTDCAVLRADSTYSTDVSTRRGRMSIKGTVYIPSGAMDVDDTDVYYPLAGRGIIARHLRIRGFQNHPGYGTPAFSNFVDQTESERDVVFLVCEKSSGACTATDPTLRGRAAVSFAAMPTPASDSTPTVKYWSVSKD